MLPRAHGSSLFQRGDTQVLNITTLGMLRMNQMIDTLDPNEARSLGKKVAESEEAKRLIERIKKVTRRRGITAPVTTGDDDGRPRALFIRAFRVGRDLIRMTKTKPLSDVCCPFAARPGGPCA